MKIKHLFLIGISFLVIAFISGCSQTEYQQGTPNNQEQDTNTPTTSASAEKIQIIDHQMETGQYGNIKIVGTAKNVAGKQLSYVEIRVRFYDKDNVLLETFMDNINDVGIDQTWAFEVMYPSIDTSKVDHYDIGVGTVF